MPVQIRHPTNDRHHASSCVPPDLFAVLLGQVSGHGRPHGNLIFVHAAKPQHQVIPVWLLNRNCCIERSLCRIQRIQTHALDDLGEFVHQRTVAPCPVYVEGVLVDVDSQSLGADLSACLQDRGAFEAALVDSDLGLLDERIAVDTVPELCRQLLSDTRASAILYRHVGVPWLVLPLEG